MGSKNTQKWRFGPADGPEEVCFWAIFLSFAGHTAWGGERHFVVASGHFDEIVVLESAGSSADHKPSFLCSIFSRKAGYCSS